MLRLDGKKTLLGVLAPEILVFFTFRKQAGRQCIQYCSVSMPALTST